MFRVQVLAFVVSVAAGLPAARASPYWIAYEGDDFPENQGWVRNYGDENGPQQGGSVRTLQDGVLGINSLRNPMIYDFYEMDRSINPGPGETFVATWRMRVAEAYGFGDVGVAIAPDTPAILGFGWYYDRMVGTTETWSIPITPGVFHTYEIRSTDMLNYNLWIDATFARSGLWDTNSINHEFINFGDGHHGGNAVSSSEWDYFGFGVVPEPSEITLFACVIIMWRKRT